MSSYVIKLRHAGSYFQALRKHGEPGIAGARFIAEKSLAWHAVTIERARYVSKILVYGSYWWWLIFKIEEDRDGIATLREVYTPGEHLSLFDWRTGVLEQARRVRV